jgi:membrane-associated phospholipid phosphatase
MDELWQFELIITIFLQHLGSWLTIPMKAFSFLGQEEFFILVLPVIYWCIDSTLGIRIFLMLMVSNGSNLFFKFVFHTPRPFWYDSRILPISYETMFGLPSGHAQVSASLFGYFSALMRKRWITLSASALIFFIGLSRVYLGVHFSSDVITGWLIGIVTIILFTRWEKAILLWFTSLKFSNQIVFCILFPLLLLLIILFPIIFISPWNPPSIWIVNATRVIALEAFNPLDPAYAITEAGTLMGFLVGAVWYHKRFGSLNTSGTTRIFIYRYFVGIFGIFIFWYGLGIVFPRSADIISYGLRFLRYILVGLWLSYFAPYVFIKLKLMKI